jgi:hypothetical protein
MNFSSFFLEESQAFDHGTVTHEFVHVSITDLNAWEANPSERTASGWRCPRSIVSVNVKPFGIAGLPCRHNRKFRCRRGAVQPFTSRLNQPREWVPLPATDRSWLEVHHTAKQIRTDDQKTPGQTERRVLPG